MLNLPWFSEDDLHCMFGSMIKIKKCVKTIWMLWFLISLPKCVGFSCTTLASQQDIMASNSQVKSKLLLVHHVHLGYGQDAEWQKVLYIVMHLMNAVTVSFPTTSTVYARIDANPMVNVQLSLGNQERGINSLQNLSRSQHSIYLLDTQLLQLCSHFQSVISEANPIDLYCRSRSSNQSM